MAYQITKEDIERRNMLNREGRLEEKIELPSNETNPITGVDYNDSERLIYRDFTEFNYLRYVIWLAFNQQKYVFFNYLELLEDVKKLNFIIRGCGDKLPDLLDINTFEKLDSAIQFLKEIEIEND